MASDKIVILTPENFNDVIHGDQPVLVDFWAEWCGPCRMVAPMLEEIAESQDKVVVAKLNVADFPDLAVQFNVQSIPAFFLFENGKVKDSMVGAPQHKSKFDRFLA